MKITSFSPFKKTVLIVFCLTISTLFSACNKIPLFQDDDQNNSEDAGVVQTDWNNNSEIKVEPEPVPKKTSPLQPVSDQESVKKSREVSEQQEQQRAEFSVQIGAFLKKDNATRMVSKLKAKGYKPSLVVVETPGKRWHLVHVGSYAGKKTALSAAQKLTYTENMETAVVKNNAIIKMQTKSVRQAGKEVVRATSALVAAGCAGVYNVACEGFLTVFDLAQLVGLRGGKIHADTLHLREGLYLVNNILNLDKLKRHYVPANLVDSVLEANAKLHGEAAS